uniref:Uncharacterized protein n=1 Tax=Dunaliella tertiolecta TaxID=3047 RepID=A0A7S3VQK4_DUNTE
MLMSRADCLMSLHKKDSVLSHWGMKKHALIKAQWQQQEAGLPISRICQHEENVESWKQHKEQLALQQAPAIGSLLYAAGQHGVAQQLNQFAAVLHHLSHQRPMIAYEQQQELEQLFYDHMLSSVMPNKHWSNDAGWSFAGKGHQIEGEAARAHRALR